MMVWVMSSLHFLPYFVHSFQLNTFYSITSSVIFPRLLREGCVGLKLGLGLRLPGCGLEPATSPFKPETYTTAPLMYTVPTSTIIYSDMHESPM
jgi:hypothetical protein